ncbi:nucleoside hydrolase [Scopulibacillus cellulosilyticus]|uniref:Nucleoside hydrolase n=1 Tax=Scopulibacillus cellulosilyticus TaxID=2665665 RepID=A0ABW2Q2J7_9BACL
MAIPVIIDTDPGIDDVVAISAALFEETLDVKLISTVGGNVGITNTTRNAMNLVHFLRKDVKVAKGSEAPLLNPLVTASVVHGETGVGGYQFSEEAPINLLHKEHAVIAMKDVILSSEEPVTLIPIGPLTNIALLIKLFPEVKANLNKIVLMGGAAKGGNATSVAEFNIYVDPHAAKIVFDESIPIVMCGLDVTRQATITKDNIDTIRNLNKTGEMLSELLTFYGDSSSSRFEYAVHDMCTIIYITHPEIFETKNADVTVVTEGPASGCTVTKFTEDGHVKVCLNADAEAFRKKVIHSISKAL